MGTDLVTLTQEKHCQELRQVESVIKSSQIRVDSQKHSLLHSSTLPYEQRGHILLQPVNLRLPMIYL